MQKQRKLRCANVILFIAAILGIMATSVSTRIAKADDSGTLCQTTTQQLSPVDSDTDAPLPSDANVSSMTFTVTSCPRDTSKPMPDQSSPNGSYFTFLGCALNQGAIASWSVSAPGGGSMSWGYQYWYHNAWKNGAYPGGISCGYVLGCDFSTPAPRVLNVRWQSLSINYPPSWVFVWGTACT